MFEWRDVWYDSEDHEIDRQNFRHESEARRKAARWVGERPGSKVELYRRRWAPRPTSEGAADDVYELVDTIT